MSIIFLDVDGVLNSMPYLMKMNSSRPSKRYSDISDFHLQMLAEIYHTCNAKLYLLRHGVS